MPAEAREGTQSTLSILLPFEYLSSPREEEQRRRNKQNKKTSTRRASEVLVRKINNGFA